MKSFPQSLNRFVANPTNRLVTYLYLLAAAWVAPANDPGARSAVSALQVLLLVLVTIRGWGWARQRGSLLMQVFLALMIAALWLLLIVMWLV